MSKFKKVIYEKFKGKCSYCGNEITLENMTVDHFIPKGRGGESSYRNCYPCCSTCNMLKANKTIEDFRKIILQVEHPRLIRKYKLPTPQFVFYFERRI